jgi:serine/threonine protein kinase
MDPDRWGNLRELFGEACELTAEERQEFLRVRCADDSELDERLRGLLEAHDRARLKLPEPEEWTPGADADLSGSTIGDYRVLEPIGAGGMGRVYRAFDVRLERYVALKTLPDQMARDDRWSARFKQEARILASLSHANIAPIYDVQLYEGRLVLVLELVEGHTLADHLARGPLRADEAIAIAQQIAAALETAHAAGVVHRDLKPANIAVAPDGSVKVLDFGIAKPLRGQPKPGQQTPTDELAATGPGQRMGTVSYMSPEMIRGLHVDARSDVWSFGVVLFEMLSAARPFAADNPADTLARILEHPPDWEALPRGVPSHLRHLLERCLEKNARQRLQAIGEARLALESASLQPAGASIRRSAVGRQAVWAAPVLALGAALLFAALSSDAPPDASRGMGDSGAWAPRQISFTGDVIEAVIAPVGPRLAALRRIGGEHLVTVFDLTGSDPVDVARGGELCCVTWSPDGSRIAFQRRGRGPASAHVVPAW